MTSMRQWLQTSRFLLFILLAMSLFGESCDNTAKQSTANSSLDTLHLPKAMPLIDYYLQSQGDVDADFYFEKDTIEPTEKVTFFAMDSNQLAFLLQEMDRLKPTPNTADSVRIRIYFAFQGKEGTHWNARPNLNPLIELISGKSGQSERVFYPLHPSNERVIPLSTITDSLAHALVQEWLNLPADSITDELYLNHKIGIKKDRLRYFTFVAKDTYDIYQFLTKNKPKNYLSVYFGKLENQPDHIPLRTIIHVTNNGAGIGKKTALDDGDENYEFSAQCPHHCQ